MEMVASNLDSSAELILCHLSNPVLFGKKTIHALNNTTNNGASQGYICKMCDYGNGQGRYDVLVKEIFDLKGFYLG